MTGSEQRQYWSARACAHGASAAHYLNSAQDWYAVRIRMRCFFDHISLRPGMRILDAGAGTGLWSIELARRGASVTALDISPAMADILAGQAARAGVNISVVCGELASVGRGRFDMVLCATSLQHMHVHHSLDELISSAARVLARNGQLVIIEYIPLKTPQYQKQCSYKRVIEYAPLVAALARNGLALRRERVISVFDMVFIHYWDALTGGRWHMARWAIMAGTYVLDKVCARMKVLRTFAKYRFLIASTGMIPK